jgi:predicted nucleic acid-binding protein
MMVIVDTSVWSLALRRALKVIDPELQELEELIKDGRAALIGPIRQEILSGVKDEKQFDRLRDNLRAFPDIQLTSEDYEEAARSFNRCRAAGVQGSNTDFLICAVAVRRDLPIFTSDRDFEGFATILPITPYRF